MQNFRHTVRNHKMNCFTVYNTSSCRKKCRDYIDIFFRLRLPAVCGFPLFSWPPLLTREFCHVEPWFQTAFSMIPSVKKAEKIHSRAYNLFKFYCDYYFPAHTYILITADFFKPAVFLNEWCPVFLPLRGQVHHPLSAGLHQRLQQKAAINWKALVLLKKSIWTNLTDLKLHYVVLSIW